MLAWTRRILPILLAGLVSIGAAGTVSAQTLLVDFDDETDAPLSLYLDQGTISRTFPVDNAFNPGFIYELISATPDAVAESIDSSRVYSDFTYRVDLVDLDDVTAQQVGLVAYASTTERDGYQLDLDRTTNMLTLSRLDDGIVTQLASVAVQTGDAVSQRVLILSRAGFDLMGIQLLRSANDQYACCDRILSATDATYGDVQLGIFAASYAGDTIDVRFDDFGAFDGPDDLDGDLVADAEDNCPNQRNGPFDRRNQLDSDQDGWGNNCDCDFTQDGIVLGDDLVMLFGQFSDPNPLFDVTGDGIILGDDVVFCFGQFNGPPG